MKRGLPFTLAGAGALLAALLWFAFARETDPARGTPPAGGGAEPCTCAGAGGAAAGTGTAGRRAPAERVALELARFAVCEREETRAALAQVSFVAERRPLWALHCGHSVHLIAIEAHAGVLVPRRVAVVRAASPSPAETAVALEAAAADVNGDGRTDWIAPVAFVDAGGVPRGGGVYVLKQRTAGGFDVPQRVIAAAPGAVAVARLDDAPGDDLVILHRADASTGRADELWLVTGGPAPLRVAQHSGTVGTSAIAALDLDRDLRDDLVAASPADGRVLVWPSASGAAGPPAPTELRVAGIEQLLAVDIDGDGTRELALVGERVWLLTGPLTGDAPPVTAPIDGSDGLRDVHLADTDADGRAELVGYAHPDVIALARVGEQRSGRRQVVSLRGDAAVLFARIAQLDADPRPDLLVVSVGVSGTDLEVGVAANLEPSAVVRLGPDLAPLGDEALVQRFTLL